MKILSLIGIMFLAACAASGVHVSEDQVSNFKKGETTYDEVVAALGPPSQKGRDSEGNVEIGYLYNEYQTRPETFIPYVGMFVGGADTRMSEASFTFTPAGILEDYSYSETALGTDTNLGANVPQDRVPTHIRDK